MRFHYIAAQPDGQIVEGDIEGRGSAEILVFIASKGLRPISLRMQKGDVDRVRAIFGQSITVGDKIFLTRYLALMLKVGTDLLRAVDILVADFTKPVMKAFLLDVRGILERGQPFHSAFLKYPRYFSPVFVNLVKAGETSGNLEEVFERLSVGLEKEQELRNKIKAAVTYPIILFGVSLLLLIFLVIFALPKIAKVFSGSGVEPPLFSKVVFAIGLFFGDHLFLVLGGLGALAAGGLLFVRSLTGRRLAYRIAFRIPVMGTLLKKIALQRFASTFGSLLRAGLPILSALEITADAVSSDEIKQGLLRVSREGISKGLTIGEAFRREPVFPNVFVNLIAISEKAGHLEEILETLANFYELEIESSVKELTAFLEPVLLLGMGALVATIAFAVIIPVYQFVGSFS